MRTTITLEDDVSAMIESERVRTGESFRAVVNRLLRRGLRAPAGSDPPRLPRLPGAPLVDVSDASALVTALDDERLPARGDP